jgi:hypothetical protein
MPSCHLCGEKTEGPVIEHDDTDRPRPDDLLPFGLGAQAHRACLLRSVLGGIGHLTNHGYWCGEMKDPDAGMTFRQSSLGVWAFVHDEGVP